MLSIKISINILYVSLCYRLQKSNLYLSFIQISISTNYRLPWNGNLSITILSTQQFVQNVKHFWFTVFQLPRPQLTQLKKNNKFWKLLKHLLPGVFVVIGGGGAAAVDWKQIKTHQTIRAVANKLLSKHVQSAVIIIIIHRIIVISCVDRFMAQQQAARAGEHHRLVG